MGAERSSRRARVIQRLQRLHQEIIVLYPDNTAICQHYAEQFTALKTAGTPIGANDLWIACHALAESATLVTNNAIPDRRLHRAHRLPPKGESMRPSVTTLDPS